MFGLSFSKLLVLAAVIAGVIFFFKMVTKLEKARREVARGEMRGETRKAAPRRERGGIGGMFRRGGAEKQTAAAEETQEMRACPTCGTYVAARGARDCGRELCPYGA